MKVKEKNKTKSAAENFDMKISALDKEKYILRLYITGTTRRSLIAVTNLRKICEEYLEGQYELEVIDLYQNPSLAKGDQIIAAPTLIKKLPLPFRRIIGDLSNIEKVILGLDLREVKGK